MIQIGIILSLVVAVLLGAIASKKVKGKTKNYYVAGRNLSALMVGFALLSQAIDGNATMVNADLGFNFGFWAGAAMIIGLALSLLLLGIFFAPKLNSLKLLTLADFFKIKYNRNIEVITSLLMLFSFGLLLAGNIAGIALLIQMFWAISYNSIVLIICLVVVIYCIGGGIISDIYSDLWQMLLVVGSIIATIIFLIWKFDFSGLLSSDIFNTSMSLTQFTANSSGALINWATIIALGFGNILAIDFCSRYLGAKSPKLARRGCFYGAALVMVVGILFSFLPILMQWLNVAPIENMPIIVAFGSQVLPSFLNTLLICGIIAAALSTIDGAVLSMSNIFAHNLLNIQKNIDPDNERETEKTYLYFSRLSLLPIICVAMIFAILLPTPGALITIAFDTKGLASRQKVEQINDLLERNGFKYPSRYSTIRGKMEEMFNQMEEGSELTALRKQWSDMQSWLLNERSHMESWTIDRVNSEIVRSGKDPELLAHDKEWEVLETALRLHEKKIDELTSGKEIDRKVADKVVAEEHQLHRLFVDMGVVMEPAARGYEGADQRALQYYQITRGLREEHQKPQERSNLMCADDDLNRKEAEKIRQAAELARTTQRQRNWR